MRTNTDVDDDLLADAMAATGQSTKKATMEEALCRVVRLHQQKLAADAMAGFG